MKAFLERRAYEAEIKRLNEELCELYEIKHQLGKDLEEYRRYLKIARSRRTIIELAAQFKGIPIVPAILTIHKYLEEGIDAITDSDHRPCAKRGPGGISGEAEGRETPDR